MKTRVTILAIVLVLTLVVGGVSAQEPVEQNAPGNEVMRVVQEQWALPAAPADACPYATACSINGFAYYVRNDNAGGTGVLGWHNNAAGTGAGVYGETSSAAAYAVGTLGRVFPEAAGGYSAAVRGFNNGRGGNGIGVWGTQMGSGWGVYGDTPRGLGVYGKSDSYVGVQAASNTGWGLFGYHANAAGTAAGVYGLTQSTAALANGVLGIVSPTNAGANSAAVRGDNRGTGGTGIGVWGSQNGSGWGVYGYAPRGLGVYGSSGSGYGVYGSSSSGYAVYGSSSFVGVAGISSGYGVYGYHSNAAGTSPGVYGLTRSTAGGANAVLGIVSPTNAGGNSAAVRGDNRGTAGLGIGVWGSQNGSGWGVLGSTPRGISVYGSTTSGWGVYGRSGSGFGVYGNSDSASGVYGYSGSWIGVYGRTNRADNNWAGFFDGNVGVVNNLVAGGAKLFRIDHPLDPANKYLNHVSVESPDMLNLYNGNVALDSNGAAWVKLPEWFGSINGDYRYQLTAVGAPGPNLYVAEQISNNRFKIAGGEAGMTVSWQVTGIRQDPYAKANPIAVEQDKPLAERGLYLHPEAYGLSAEMGLSSLFQQWQPGEMLTLEQEALGFEALSPVPLLDQRMPAFGQGAPGLFERPSSVPLLDSLERESMQGGAEVEDPSTLLPALP